MDSGVLTIIILTSIFFLATFIYNVRKKENALIIANIAIDGIIVTLEMMYYYFPNNIGALLSLLVTLAMLIFFVMSIVNIAKEYKENHQLRVGQVLGLIAMIYFLGTYKFTSTPMFGMPIFETDEEKKAYLEFLRFAKCGMRIMCEIPIANLFIMLSTKNKEVNQ